MPAESVQRSILRPFNLCRLQPPWSGFDVMRQGDMGGRGSVVSVVVQWPEGWRFAQKKGLVG